LFAYECLTRGVDRDGEIIPPDRMFSVARETGRLVDLDLAARFKAIETVARLNVGETMFININPHTILEPCECVEGALRAVLDQRLDPQQFVFEVVESERIADSDALVRVLAHYREAGFRVALDDLGAGYSSLNLLAEVKPDFIKVDRKLLQGIEQDSFKAQVAAKLLELAHDLGVRSVAEGVETESQWQWARDHGADFAQGFYLARPAPLPVSTLASTVAQNNILTAVR
jgi:EAL domain-containing protein (putative c-di-GMP-specific phosphodiesterase class I)